MQIYINENEKRQYVLYQNFTSFLILMLRIKLIMLVHNANHVCRDQNDLSSCSHRRACATMSCVSVCVCVVSLHGEDLLRRITTNLKL